MSTRTDELRKFLDAAGGEGLVLGGVDAGDLFGAFFGDALAGRPAPAATWECPECHTGGCEVGKCHIGAKPPAPAAAADEPDGRLHADGYFTWHKGKRPDYIADRLLPCDFFLTRPAAPLSEVEPKREMWPATEMFDLKPIGYANTEDILRYAKIFAIGPHIPGVRDVAVYTKHQLKAAVAHERNNTPSPSPQPNPVSDIGGLT